MFYTGWFGRKGQYFRRWYYRSLWKREVHTNVRFVPNVYRERAVCISRLSFRFLFVRLDEKRSLQNKGGYTKRISAGINKRDVTSDEQHAMFAHELRSELRLTAAFSNIFCELWHICHSCVKKNKKCHLTFQSLLFTWCTTSLTFTTTVRSAHTVFICFVFIWEQTATCATYSINWLVFITDMKSVYCAVRTGYLNKAVCASSLKG